MEEGKLYNAMDLLGLIISMASAIVLLVLRASNAIDDWAFSSLMLTIISYPLLSKVVAPYLWMHFFKKNALTLGDAHFWRQTKQQLLNETDGYDNKRYRYGYPDDYTPTDAILLPDYYIAALRKEDLTPSKGYTIEQRNAVDWQGVIIVNTQSQKIIQLLDHIYTAREGNEWIKENLNVMEADKQKKIAIPSMIKETIISTMGATT